MLVSTSRSLRKWYGCFLLGDTYVFELSEGDGIGVCNRDVLSGVFNEMIGKAGVPPNFPVVESQPLSALPPIGNQKRWHFVYPLAHREIEIKD